MAKKSKKAVYVVIAIVIVLVGSMAVRLFIANTYKMQQNIYFTEYDMNDTAIWKYDPLREEVSEVGKLSGNFYKCVIDRDEAYITGLIYDKDEQVTKLVRYELATGRVEFQELEAYIKDATGMVAGEKILIYDGGNKFLVSYYDIKQDQMWLFYDFITGQYDIVKGDTHEVDQFLGVYDGTLWYTTYAERALCRYDLETREKTKVLDSVHDASVNSAAGIIAYTKKNNSKMIYLYDMNSRRTKHLALMRWNTYYANLYSESQWSNDGRLFFYVTSFIKFFNAADDSFMVYDYKSGKKFCIFKVRNTLHRFGYIASEQ